MIDVRKGRPRDARIDSDITTTALDLLSEVGFDRFSVEEVASRSGVAKTTIYRRFPTRNDLLVGALERLNDDLPVPPAQWPIRERLVAVLTPLRQRQSTECKGRLINVAMSQQCGDPGLSTLVLKRVIGPRRALLRTVLNDAVARGELRADLDIDSTVPLLVGSMMYLGMSDQRGLDAPSVDAVVATVLDGLRA